MSKRLAGTGLAIGLVAGAGAGLILEMSGSAGASSGAAWPSAAVADATTDSTVPGDSTAPVDTAEARPIDPAAGNPAAADRRRHDHPGSGRQGHRCAGRGPSRPIRWAAQWAIATIMMGPGGFGLDVVANALDITADEVRTALQDGQSLADLAVSKGKTAQDVIDAIVAEATTRSTPRSRPATSPRPRPTRFSPISPKFATDFVNNAQPAGGPGFGGPGMGRGFGGPVLRSARSSR